MTVTEPLVEYVPDEDERLSTAVVNALSQAKGRDVIGGEYVLYDSVDPDALDGMFRRKREGNVIRLEFTTHDAVVRIWGNGRTVIRVLSLEPDRGHG